ncbi:MAG: hypothetical protein ABTQ34_04155 [Bdellovibrionales bacterium]
MVMGKFLGAASGVALAFSVAGCVNMKPAEAVRLDGAGDVLPIGFSTYVNEASRLMAVCAFMDNGKPGNSHDHMQFRGLYQVPEPDSAQQWAEALRQTLSVNSNADLNRRYDKWAEFVIVPHKSDEEPLEIDALVGIGAEQWVSKTIKYESRITPVDSSEHKLLVKNLEAAQRGQLSQGELHRLQTQIDKLSQKGADASAYLEQAAEKLGVLCDTHSLSKGEALPQGWRLSFSVGSYEQSQAALELMTASALYISATAQERLPVRPKEYVQNPEGTLRAAKF